MKDHHLSKSLKVNQRFKDVGDMVGASRGNGKVGLMHGELGHLPSRVWPCGRLAFPFPELQISDERVFNTRKGTELSLELSLESRIRWE